MTFIIRRTTMAEFEAAPNLAQLLAEYGQHSGVPELGTPKAQFATYRALEATGMFHLVGAWDGERLAGFIAPIVLVLPHYGVVAATVESFFVPQAERRRGLGMRLLRHAERLAKELGAKGVLVSAPAGSALAKVMKRHRPYRMSNEVFVRALA